MVVKDLKAGLPIALVSVLLISTAQLSMKWGMGGLASQWDSIVALFEQPCFGDGRCVRYRTKNSRGFCRSGGLDPYL